MYVYIYTYIYIYIYIFQVYVRCIFQISDFPGLPAQQRKESEGICAKVTIRIVQELVLTRQAFEGVLEVGNNAAPLPMLLF